MEPCKCTLKLSKCFVSDYFPMNKIAKPQKCSKSANNVISNMPFNCREVYLTNISILGVPALLLNANLHKGL